MFHEPSYLQAQNNSFFVISCLFQFREGSKFKRLGLLNANRFGEFFFDNVHQLATKAVKEFEKPALERQAIASGRPMAELEREQRYPFAKPQVFMSNNAPRNNQQGHNSKSEVECVYVGQSIG